MIDSDFKSRKGNAKSLFILPFTVRDYECDMQGIVNNAVYQNYFEHTRHQFLKSKQLDFAQITDSGVNLVVYRAEIDYKSSLKSGEEFDVTLDMEIISKVRVAFRQSIIRKNESKPCVVGLFLVTGISSTGRPHIPEYIVNLASDKV